MNKTRGAEDAVPMSVVGVVNALCADYDRRKRILAENARAGTGNETVEADVLSALANINAAVDNALTGVEVTLREVILYDIASGRGYYRSRAQTVISKGAYYRRRRRVVYDIAVELALI